MAELGGNNAAKSLISVGLDRASNPLV